MPKRASARILVIDLARRGAAAHAFALVARKSLGQHFITDPDLLAEIATASGSIRGHHIIEIGAGTGTLTQVLLEQGAAEISAVEKDQRCLEILLDLQQRYQKQLTLIADDALKVDLTTLIATPTHRKPRLIANLPYNIASRLIVNWLSVEPWPSIIDHYTLMLQREVAQRMAAAKGSRVYGLLSVLCQLRCRVEVLFDVPPEAFSPRPKVHSQLVRLTPQATHSSDVSYAEVKSIATVAFAQRRKMLRVSLRRLPIIGADCTAILQAAKIDPQARAETLAPADFIRLAEHYRQFLAAIKQSPGDKPG